MASIRKRTWIASGVEKSAWVLDYKDQSGARKVRQFPRKKDAEDFRDTALFEVKQGTHATTKATVAEAGEKWIRRAELDDLERSTIRQYRQHLDLHIKPLIGAVKLADLNRPTVREFEERLLTGDMEAGKSRSKAMTRKIVSSLGSILAEAMERGLVSQNVVRAGKRTRRKRGERTRPEIPTKDEMRALLAGASDPWRPLIVTALFTGLRASELRGLTWGCVDFEGGVIKVEQRADRWNKMGPPKSDAGFREIPMAPMVLNTLREWKLVCPKGALDLTFPNGAGNVESHENIYRRGFGALQTACGIVGKDGKHKYGLHALRHAAASLFIEQGFMPKKVQALMGHSSIQMTFDTYGHLFPTPEEDHEAMAQVEARLLA